MLQTEIILAFILLPPMLLLSGLVSGSETAIFGISHAERTKLKNSSPGAAAAVDALLRYPRHLLTALLALNNLINVTYFSVSSVLAVKLQANDNTAAAAILGVVSLIAIILVGEIAAKLLANSRTIAFCRVAAPPWLLIIRLGWPVWNTLDRSILRPLVRLASSAQSPTDQPSAQDLAAVLAASNAADARSAADQNLLLQILNLREQRVRHATRPRVETTTLPINAPAERFDRAFDTERNILVTEPDASGTEQILGWLNAARFLADGSPTRPRARRALLERPLYLPELATLDAALKQLRDAGKERAVVVDERGTIEGTIQIEDIVATIIRDAADQPADTLEQPQLVGLGVFSIPGRWPARALLDDLDIDHAQADQLLSRVSTVGGLALTLLRKVPSPGDTAQLPGATLTVTETIGRVVVRVEVTFHAIANDPDRNPGGQQ